MSSLDLSACRQDHPSVPHALESHPLNSNGSRCDNITSSKVSQTVKDEIDSALRKLGGVCSNQAMHVLPDSTSLRVLLQPVIDYINVIFDVLFGAKSDDALYFQTHGKVFVIEEMDVLEMERRQGNPLYKSSAGQLAGLNPKNRPYLKRLHILVDSRKGAYAANKLHDNYHYQVKVSDLSDYLIDVLRQKIHLRVAGHNDCGTLGGRGVCLIDAPTPGSTDCVIYTASTPFVISNTYLDRDSSEMSASPSFFCAFGEGISEFESYVDELRIKDMFTCLEARGDDTSVGASMRNQKASLDFGLNFLNCCDTTREALHFLPSPKQTTSLDTVPGIGDDASMAISMKYAMVSLTKLMDALCNRFELPLLFNCPSRTKTYASEIIEGNRLEKITIAMCNDPGLGCHLDVHNSRFENYTWNVSYFEYVRNPKYKLAASLLYYIRLHVGGYGRRICDTTLVQAENISRLLEDLLAFISSLDQRFVKYDPDVLLLPMQGDIATEFNTSIVARKIHINKSVHYSFYVFVISRWILRRKETGVFVSFPELIEAVHTATRWTASPSTWAYIFEEVTNPDGVSVYIPHDMQVSDYIQKIFDEETRVMPRVASYASPFPLHVLYILKSIQLTGGVARGKSARFQPFANQKYINLVDEERSVENHLQHASQLLSNTSKARKEYAKEINTDTLFTEFAELISDLSSAYVLGVASNFNKGGIGCLGIGQLGAHHALGILSYGGWFDSCHMLNVNFSKGNGTVEFLLCEYELNVVKNKRIIEVLANALSNDFGIFSKLVAENAVCKLGQESRDNKDCTFLETVHLRSFLIDVKDGQHVTREIGGVMSTIESGVISSKSVEPTLAESDWRVLNRPRHPDFTTHQYWLLDQDASKFFDYNAETKFQAIDGKISHALQDQKRLKKKTVPKQPRSTVPGQSTERSFVKPSHPWAQVKRKVEVKRKVRKLIEVLLEEALFSRGTTLLGIGDTVADTDLAVTLRTLCNDDKKKLNSVRDEAIIMWKTLYTCDDPNELNSDNPHYVDRYLADYFNQIVADSQPQRKSQRRTIVQRTSKEDDAALSQSNYNCIERKLDGIDHDRTDLDECYRTSFHHMYNHTCVHADNFILPRFSKMEKIIASHCIMLDLSAEIAGILKVKQCDVNIVTKKTKVNGFSYYNCSLVHNNIVHRSDQPTFLQGPRGRLVHPFRTGLVTSNDNRHYYETKTHAKLALLLVIMMQVKPESIEERFLNNSDFCVVTPTERWAYDIDDISDQQISSPICCFWRCRKNIIAFDIDQLQFLDFERDSVLVVEQELTQNTTDTHQDDCMKMNTAEAKVVQEKTVNHAQKTTCPEGNRRIKRCAENIVVNGKRIDKKRMYYNNDSNQWEQLPKHMIDYFATKSARHTYTNSGGTHKEIGLVSFIAVARLMLQFQVPLNTISSMKSGSATPPGWYTVTMAHGDGTRQSTYYYTPKCQFQLRSKLEVEKFVLCLNDTGDDEQQAMTLFTLQKKERSAAQKMSS